MTDPMTGPMTGAVPYQYVTLRCVPRVDREEFLNVGVLLYCQALDYLDCACDVPVDRLRAVAPDVDLEAVFAGLRFVEGVCRGDHDLGEIASHDLGIRFGFLKAPRSTVVQPGPVHGGIAADPAHELTRLLERLVR